MHTITTRQLKQMQERDPNLTLINTLPEEHFEQTRVPGAINIPLDSKDFVARVEQQAGGRDQPVVVYCASAQCNSSEKAAEQLKKAGFTSVLDYQGGAEAWQNEEAGVHAG
jgi:rhodanese-related sulfurtransferase